MATRTGDQENPGNGAWVKALVADTWTGLERQLGAQAQLDAARAQSQAPGDAPVRPGAEITVNEDGDDIDATVTAPGIAAMSGPFVSTTRYKITRDGPVAKFLPRQFRANS